MNKYKISFEPTAGVGVPQDLIVQAKAYELENDFFSFIGDVAGREEIIRSVRASNIREVTLLGAA